MDAFAVATLRNLLSRLEQHGLRKEHRILDYGCGNGLFVTFLRERGYEQVEGFDPYVPAFETCPARLHGFDWIVANDVIEHCDEPKGLLERCHSLLRTGGHLYVGMPDADGVTSMRDLDRHVTRLHQPFHRVIMSQRTLNGLADRVGLHLQRTYRRSYMDTLRPFANYRFLDELCRAVDHDMDQALNPLSSARAFVTHPRLWLFAVGGYFFPTAMEPASIWTK
jgi:SAM-dependent methyltransferase